MNNGGNIDICFLDISEAFEIVNYRIITANIATFGVSPQVVGWLPSFLAYHPFQIRIDYFIAEGAVTTSDVT